MHEYSVMAMVNSDLAPNSRVQLRNNVTWASTFAETILWRSDITLEFRRQPTYLESESVFSLASTLRHSRLYLSHCLD